MPTILLIRHAQASYGAADYDVLSDVGAQQVVVLREALVRRGLQNARIVSGPAQRHRQTAALAHDRDVPVDPRWDEYATDAVLAAHGPSTVRLQRSAGAAQPPVSSRHFQSVLDGALGRWIAAGAGGSSSQTWDIFLRRVTEAMGDLVNSLVAGETALVFTSGGAIAAVCSAVLGAPETCFVTLNRVQINTGISKLAIGRSGTTLVSFNDHGHLEDVDPALVTYR